MRTLDDAEVSARTRMADAVSAVSFALGELGRGAASQSPKHVLPGATEGAMHLSLAGVVPSLGVAVSKWASYVPGTGGAPGTSSSIILVSDHASGHVRALVEGMAATTLRTAAATLATIAQYPVPPRRVALVGYGQVNQAVADALVALVPSVEELRIATRTGVVPALPTTRSGEAASVHRSVRDALVGADLVVSATGVATALGDVADVPDHGIIIALDGQRVWRGVSGVPALSDHDQPIPSLARAFAHADDGAFNGVRFVDLGGSAVADAAFCSLLVGDDA